MQTENVFEMGPASQLTQGEPGEELEIEAPQPE